MKFDATTLPDDSAVLKDMLLELQSKYDQQTSILLEQIQLLRAQLYGRKSEKFPKESTMTPLPLFDIPENGAPEEEQGEEDVHIPAHTRKKGGRKPLPEDLPRVDQIHDIDEAEKVCACA